MLSEFKQKDNSLEKKNSESNIEKEQVEDLFEELSLGLLSIQEEIEFLDPETVSLDRINARLKRAEQLFNEAKQEFDNKDLSEARVKAAVAQNMLKKAQTLMSV